jgi:hypothetical protein
LRSRFLSREEAQRLIAALEADENRVAANAILLFLLTGAAERPLGVADVAQRALGVAALHLQVAADLPAERPTRFELIVKLKTAKALGADNSRVLLSARSAG